MTNINNPPWTGVARAKGERLDNDPSGARYGCFLPDLTGLARRLPAPTSQAHIYDGVPGFARWL